MDQERRYSYTGTAEKGKEVTVEGFFKPESYTKDGNNVTPCVREKKQDGPKEEKKKRLKQPYLSREILEEGSLFFLSVGYLYGLYQASQWT